MTDLSFTPHGPLVLDILNDAIITSTALYDYKPRTIEMMRDWFETKAKNNFPVIGIVEQDQLLGFATYGTFRTFPAYKYTVEHSVYVHKDHRGKGLGHQLLGAIIQRARMNNVRVMVGVIDSKNQTSIDLHKTHHFTHAGTLKSVGYKFGQWLDVDFYQLILDGPTEPTE